MKHVLIIEDDRWQGDIYRDILEAHDFVVTVCGDGQRAIETINETLPHAIVLDLMLPDANGVAFLHELKSYEDSASVPVIICTATRLSPLFRQALKYYGVHLVLDKAELEPEQLVTVLSEVTYAT